MFQEVVSLTFLVKKYKLNVCFGAFLAVHSVTLSCSMHCILYVFSCIACFLTIGVFADQQMNPEV